MAETFDLLSGVFGPYCFTVSGDPGEQQAIFHSESHRALFYVRLHEFIAVSPGIYSGSGAPRNLSLLDASRWLCEEYPDEATDAGLKDAMDDLENWLDQPRHVRFWSGELSRHVELEASFRELLAPHSHFLKHTLLKLSREIERLQKYAARLSCQLSALDAVAAKEEYAQHLGGMMEYHATMVAEMFGRYFLAFHSFVASRYMENPSNRMDRIKVPGSVSSDVFRYLYASALFWFGHWDTDRIKEFVPETAPSLREPYPQHWDADPHG